MGRGVPAPGDDPLQDAQNRDPRNLQGCQKPIRDALHAETRAFALRLGYAVAEVAQDAGLAPEPGSVGPGASPGERRTVETPEPQGRLLA